MNSFVVITVIITAASFTEVCVCAQERNVIDKILNNYKDNVALSDLEDKFNTNEAKEEKHFGSLARVKQLEENLHNRFKQIPNDELIQSQDKTIDDSVNVLDQSVESIEPPPEQAYNIPLNIPSSEKKVFFILNPRAAQDDDYKHILRDVLSKILKDRKGLRPRVAPFF